MKVDKRVLKFEWNEGNIGKNKKHNVEDKEAEEVFFDGNKVTFPDIIHSTDDEERSRILGKTKKGRSLFIVFTKRDEKMRIISARDVNRKEVLLYEKTT